MTKLYCFFGFHEWRYIGTLTLTIFNAQEGQRIMGCAHCEAIRFMESD